MTEEPTQSGASAGGIAVAESPGDIGDAAWVKGKMQEVVDSMEAQLLGQVPEDVENAIGGIESLLHKAGMDTEGTEFLAVLRLSLRKLDIKAVNFTRFFHVFIEAYAHA